MAKRKNKTLRLYVFNVKLYSNDREGEQAYVEIFTKIFRNKIRGAVALDADCILRTQFVGQEGSRKFLYGKIARFTRLDEKQWFDIERMELRNDVSIPPGVFPNIKETEYFFIPQAHRFCVVDTPGTVSLNMAGKFLKKALEVAREPDEETEVVIEQDVNGFEEILSAQAIRKLQVEISYSNNDTNEESAEFIDGQLKQLRAKTFKIEAIPDSSGSLQPNHTIVSGALKLAQSNGSAKATIVDQENIRRVVQTTSYPRKERVLLKEGDEPQLNVFRKIMSIFRP